LLLLFPRVTVRVLCAVCVSLFFFFDGVCVSLLVVAVVLLLSGAFKKE
jgi:hypothetical protein